MEVTIKNQCARCKREDEKTVSLDEAVSYSEKLKSQQAVQDAIISDVIDLMKPDQAPVVLVALKVDGEVKVNAYSNICVREGKGSCTHRVSALLDEVFLNNEGKTQVKRGRKRAANPPSETVTEPDVSVEMHDVEEEEV